jgi:hypothetical protein
MFDRQALRLPVFFLFQIHFQRKDFLPFLWINPVVNFGIAKPCFATQSAMPKSTTG